jgi:hypothetical protein
LKVRAHAAALCYAALLTGCGGMSVWPLGPTAASDASRKPANATEYLCDGRRTFYVRNIDAGAVWLIAPDREIRLEKSAGADQTYSAGKVRLELAGVNATLLDPPAQFTGCKRADAKP